MYRDPCAILMMRVTPKISDSPTATKNSPDALDSPLTAWKRREERVIALHPSPESGRRLRTKRADGWGPGSLASTRPLRRPPSPANGGGISRRGKRHKATSKLISARGPQLLHHIVGR